MTQQEKMIKAICTGVGFDNAAINAGARNFSSQGFSKIALFRQGPGVQGDDHNAKLIPRWRAIQMLAQQ